MRFTKLPLILEMSTRWTNDCEAQKVLQKLVDEGKIIGSTEPQEARALAPEVFRHFNNQVFALHLRKTKMANSKFSWPQILIQILIKYRSTSFY